MQCSLNGLHACPRHSLVLTAMRGGLGNAASQGVHVPAAGKLMAVVEPVVPIRLPTRRTLRQRQQALAGERGGGSWRSDGEGGGVGAADSERGLLPHAGGLASAADAAADAAMAAADAEAEAEAELEAEQQEEVLRAAAHQVALLAAKLRDEGVEVRHMPDPAGRFEEARRWQRCEFRLELAVAPAAGAGGSGEAPDGAAAAAAALGRRMAPSGRRRSLGPGPGQEVGDLLLNGTLTSRNCGTRLTLSLATAHVEEYYSKAVGCTAACWGGALTGRAVRLLLLQGIASCSGRWHLAGGTCRQACQQRRVAREGCLCWAPTLCTRNNCKPGHIQPPQPPPTPSPPPPPPPARSTTR